MDRIAYEVAIPACSVLRLCESEVVTITMSKSGKTCMYCPPMPNAEK